jgi:hypothetical protein
LLEPAFAVIAEAISAAATLTAGFSGNKLAKTAASLSSEGLFPRALPTATGESSLLSFEASAAAIAVFPERSEIEAMIRVAINFLYEQNRLETAGVQTTPAPVPVKKHTWVKQAKL